MEKVENKKWYALRVVNGKEKKIKEYLDKLIKSKEIENYISRILLPSTKSYKIRKGKKYKVDKNFFPGYLLVEADINGEVIHVIENSPDVIGFLKNGKKPTPLKDTEIKRILSKVDETSDKVFHDDIYVVGENVEIISGPFATFNGEIIDIDKDKNRLKVNVKIFGRETSVDLEMTQISRPD